MTEFVPSSRLYDVERGERAYLVRFPENGEVPSLLELVGTDGGDAR